ncbi:RagB/SusD family nutrient uptake outer membrane protein [Niabella ginsengisoli]|uniref:RagB/SusD family nutrient uptake outer membrane protein n=1 Tax=Niabella ginsengisoli TaxID=522298 RepID=A0ABS9SMB9_9BACT|nr:RagB/SusD family nutrient uptake outer membrane protein [Niabella ginsengisoli]MCH5599507.1 RagB/SusD family nutrient uptake outer membrane protein [Niabella ginsengisoli]
MFFNGFATDELFLIKAECLTRLERPDEAMQVLNQLLVKRFDKSSFTPIVVPDGKSALDIILEERRKELCLRGMWRWIDTRRYNAYDDKKIIPQRLIDGQIYSLEPGSLHYAFLIPQAVVDQGSVEQNKR